MTAFLHTMSGWLAESLSTHAALTYVPAAFSCGPLWSGMTTSPEETSSLSLLLHFLMAGPSPWHYIIMKQTAKDASRIYI